MSAVLIDTTGLFWAYSEEDERRFRRILLRVAAIFTVLSVVMPWLPVPDLLMPTPPPPPPLARLILPPKPPLPVVRPVQPRIKPAAQVTKAAPKPVVKPTPAKPIKKAVAAAPQPVDAARAARAKAQRSGLLAFKDALADLRDQPVTTGVNTKTRRSGSGGAASAVERSLITSDLTRGSGGINTASLSRDTGGAGLAGHKTTRVKSSLASNGGGSAAGNTSTNSTGRNAGRSVEEIQTIFDRNKGAIYAIYNRALRSDPSLQGKVVLKLTITPSGRVSACRVVASDLNAAELESKLTGRVLLFDFGAKDVGELTITYPLDFLPA